MYGRIHVTPELREKETNLEIAFGGCRVGSRGTHKIVCTQCGSHTYNTTNAPWFDKTTKVISTHNAIKPTIDAEQ